MGGPLSIPNFRGRNRRPEATGSELAVEDIVSAVDYGKRTTRIDENRIYLVGTSGGGYSCLLMAGRHPRLWAGVSAWVPIYDLEAWYYETKERIGAIWAKSSLLVVDRQAIVAKWMLSTGNDHPRLI